MSKSKYPDSLCMIGRVGHFETVINGVYYKMQSDAKKNDVRLFYEKKQHDVLLCYGALAWKDMTGEDTEKPPKGWMIGWWQELAEHERPDPDTTRRLFIAARCRIGDTSNNFLWEVRNEDGDFVSDAATQLVLLPTEAQQAQAEGAPQVEASPKVTLRLADDVGLRPRNNGTPQQAPLSIRLADEIAVSPMSSYAAMSPFAGLLSQGLRFPPSFGLDWNQQSLAGKGGKKKKGRSRTSSGNALTPTAAGYPPAAGAAGGAGLRAEATPFVPSGAFLPPGTLPGGTLYEASPSAELMRVAQRAKQPNQTPPTPGKVPAAPPTPKRPTEKVDGMASSPTEVEWELAHLKEKIASVKKGEGVQSPEFQFFLKGKTGPAMTLTFFPTGRTMSPPGCVAVMLECPASAHMKFKLLAGTQKSGPKVLMGKHFHVDFSLASVFGKEGEDIEAPPFEQLEIGIELLDWI